MHADFAQAVSALEKAVSLSQGREPQFLAALADGYSKAGRPADAVQSARRALDLALQFHDVKLQQKLREDIARYENEKEKSKSR